MITRRAFLQSVAAAPLAANAWSQTTSNVDVGYGSTTIPVGHPIADGRPASTASRCTSLEAGFETPDRPAVLLIHGFPELGYSWRKVMLPLAAGRLSRDRAGPARLRAQRRHRRRRSTTT